MEGGEGETRRESDTRTEAEGEAELVIALALPDTVWVLVLDEMGERVPTAAEAVEAPDWVPPTLPPLQVGVEERERAMEGEARMEGVEKMEGVVSMEGVVAREGVGTTEGVKVMVEGEEGEERGVEVRVTPEVKEAEGE